MCFLVFAFGLVCVWARKAEEDMSVIDYAVSDVRVRCVFACV